MVKQSELSSDIQFWNNRKSLEGLSVRSVFFNVFQSLIVLLYVLDNETNTIIKVSCFVGLAIEIWKINKVRASLTRLVHSDITIVILFQVLDISVDRETTIFGLIPRPVFKDKGSYEGACEIVQ